MNWWQRLCITTAQVFFATLVNSNEKVKMQVRPYAIEIIASLRMAYPDLESEVLMTMAKRVEVGRS
jgi:hypothetical protein